MLTSSFSHLSSSFEYIRFGDMNSPRCLPQSLLVAALLLALTPTACGASMQTLQGEAALGHTEKRAPLAAKQSIDIDAPPQAVWQTLTAVDA
jgi:hypothetical protein